MLPEIIADENLDARIIAALRGAAFSVLSIAEQCPGMDDRAILRLARERRALLITEDSDFGELVFSFREPTVGIVFLRYDYRQVLDIAESVRGLLTKQSPGLWNRFTTLTPHKVRTRDV